MRIDKRKSLGVGAALGAAGILYGAYKLSGPGGAVGKGKSRALPLRGDEKVPKTADVVIIGGGIVGACAALFLAEKGLSVVLCEKGAIAGEASGRAQGQVSAAMLDPRKLELISMSKEIWAGLNSRTGFETGYRRNGLISPFLDDSTAGTWEEWLSSTGGKAADARILTAKQANEALPSSTSWAGAYYDPSDGGAEPTLSAHAVAEAARNLGARILVPCAVRGVEMSAGRISGVVTERGPIRASAVVLAAGCWSSKFLSNLGIKLPSVNVFSSLSRVTMANPPQTFPGNFEIPGAMVRRHLDGSFSLGATSGRIPITPQLLANLGKFRHVIFDSPWDVTPHLGSYFLSELFSGSKWSLDKTTPFEKKRILEPAADPTLLARVQSNIERTFPQFGKIDVKETWGGALMVVPDNIPVLDEAPNQRGLFLATGFTYGITMGPAGAMLIAQLVAGERPQLDMSMFRYSRFVDGSVLEFTH